MEPLLSAGSGHPGVYVNGAWHTPECARQNFQHCSLEQHAAAPSNDVSHCYFALTSLRVLTPPTPVGVSESEDEGARFAPLLPDNPLYYPDFAVRIAHILPIFSAQL